MYSNKMLLMNTEVCNLYKFTWEDILNFCEMTYNISFKIVSKI